MENKTAVKKNSAAKSKANVKQVDENSGLPNNVADKKQKTVAKKSFGIVPDAVGRSAVNQVKANSSRNIRGSNGLANTGTIISYD
ncbi:MAG: hypothetical protein LH615_15215 [Ferruginibacter sp.]|nr:hypothetical protein [Ferruginibacter sp.]